MCIDGQKQQVEQALAVAGTRVAWVTQASAAASLEGKLVRGLTHGLQYLDNLEFTGHQPPSALECV